MIRTGIGIALIAVAIIAGLYMGVWVCMVGGVISVVDGASQSPVDAVLIAWGIAKFLCASLVGWLTFIVGALIGAAVIATAEPPKT